MAIEPLTPRRIGAPGALVAVLIGTIVPTGRSGVPRLMRREET
jgi:hypothetical protein